jgi:hypothetical protein
MYNHGAMPERNFVAISSTLEGTGNPVPDPQKVVLAILAAIGANDFEALRPHFTADAELHIYGFPASEGSWRGREHVLKAIESNFGMIAEQHPQIESMVHQDSILALRVHEIGRQKSNSVRYEANGVIWFTFEGAQVKRIEEFFHSVLGG